MPPARAALPQPGRLRLGPARHAGPRRRPPPAADRRRQGPGPARPPGGRERQRPGRAGGGPPGPRRQTAGPAPCCRPLRPSEPTAQDGPGIETLVVALGANNALGSVVRLEVCWSTEDYLGRAGRPAPEAEGRLHGLAALALRGRVGRRRRRHRADRRPPRHRGHGPGGDHPAGEPGRRAPRSGPSRATSRTTPDRGSPTPSSTPAAIPTSRRTMPGPSIRPSTPTTPPSSTPSAPPGPRAATGTCSTSEVCSTASRRAATQTRGPPRPGPTGGSRTSSRRPWPRWILRPTRGSSSRARTAASTAASSRSTAPIRPRSATGSSPRRSSASWSWPA